MTPKEAYEARKAARIEARRAHPQQASMRHADKDEEMLDLFDRFVTAAERIADALETANQPQNFAA